MEEAIWVLAPIAVAVLMYLLDHRAARRHEAGVDWTREKLHDMEVEHVREFGAVEKSIAIVDKVLEYITGRLDALEGTDTKDQGDRMEAHMQELRSSMNGLGLMYQDMQSRLAEALEPPPPATTRRRKAE